MVHPRTVQAGPPAAGWTGTLTQPGNPSIAPSRATNHGTRHLHRAGLQRLPARRALHRPRLSGGVLAAAVPAGRGHGGPVLPPVPHSPAAQPDHRFAVLVRRLQSTARNHLCQLLLGDLQVAVRHRGRAVVPAVFPADRIREPVCGAHLCRAGVLCAAAQPGLGHLCVQEAGAKWPQPDAGAHCRHQEPGPGTGAGPAAPSGLGRTRGRLH